MSLRVVFFCVFDINGYIFYFKLGFWHIFPVIFLLFELNKFSRAKLISRRPLAMIIPNAGTKYYFFAI